MSRFAIAFLSFVVVAQAALFWHEVSLFNSANTNAERLLTANGVCIALLHQH